MIKVQVGDIVEVSLLNGRFTDVGEVVDIIPFCGQNDILVKSHRIIEDEPVCFSERQVSAVISKSCVQGDLSAVIDEITRG
tara:strand:+ start:135 stop:377 length:243 start_codon:yes stop_codon:yes gene_type:complete